MANSSSKHILIFFLKGLLMGSADIIPGISGGTIALITGIYDKLVFAIKSIDLKFLLYLFLSPFDKKYVEKAKSAGCPVKKEFISLIEKNLKY